MPEYNATGIAPNFANQKRGTPQFHQQAKTKLSFPRQACRGHSVASRKLFRARIRGQVVLYASLRSSAFFLSFVVLWTRRSLKSLRIGSRGEHAPIGFSGLLFSVPGQPEATRRTLSWLARSYRATSRHPFSAEKCQLNTKRASSPRVYLPDIRPAKRALEKQGKETISQTAVGHGRHLPNLVLSNVCDALAQHLEKPWTLPCCHKKNRSSATRRKPAEERAREQKCSAIGGRRFFPCPAAPHARMHEAQSG